MPANRLRGTQTPISRVRAQEKRAFELKSEVLDYDTILDDLYEKIYFHEIDVRDKSTQRLQLPLVTFVALAGFVGYMQQNVQRDITGIAVTVFWILLGAACAGLVAAGVFFVRSVAGKSYKLLPTPDEWEVYHKESAGLYADYENRGGLITVAIRKSLVARYIECGTHNGKINALKSSLVFRLQRCLITAIGCTFLAYGTFFFGQLDKSLLHRPQRVEITNPITIRNDTMVNQKQPPPPPPAPSAREIKEDRSKPTNRPPSSVNPTPQQYQGTNNGR